MVLPFLGEGMVQAQCRQSLLACARSVKQQTRGVEKEGSLPHVRAP